MSARRDNHLEAADLASTIEALSAQLDAERRRALRNELLLNLATLPNLALEAPPQVQGPPAAERGPGRQAVSPDDTGEPAGLCASMQHLAEMINSILAGLGVSVTGILLFDRTRNRLLRCGLARAGGNGPEAPETLVAGDPLDETVFSRVFHESQPYRLDRSTLDPDGQRLLDQLGATSLIAAPIFVESEARGVLFIASSRPRPLDDEDLAFLVILAARIGLLIERAELTQLQRIVERQRAQAAARQELLGIVTHELKTPVAVMRAYAEVLMERARKAQRTDEVALLQRIDDQAERLLSMVEQLLDLQRLDAGLFPLEISRVDLTELALRVVEGLQLTARDVRLRVEGRPGVVVRADRRRVEQVLINLLQNAIRFSPPGGEVVVRVQGADRLPPAAEMDRPAPSAGGATGAGALDGVGGWALVSVSDRGRGVADVDRSRIFERFYQGQGSQQPHRGHSGLGVGLYIAREIIARHGGRLWLEARTPGSVGATFTFALPVLGPEIPESDGAPALNGAAV
jgi:signal transduction histidine kinase